MKTKSLFKSKTFYFNTLTLLVVIATVFGYTPNEELASQATGVLVTLAPIINIALRMVTKEPVKVL